jgi:hypothetical protein
VFRHVVMFRWIGAPTEEQKEALRAGLTRLPEIIPEIRSYRFGEDLGIDEGNFDFAVTADFDDRASYVSYRDNDDHRKLIAELVKPIATDRAAVQFEWPAALPSDLPG